MQRAAAYEGDRVSREVARDLEPARTERRVMSSWSEVTALIERNAYDVAFASRLPRRRLDRRRLIAASAEAGTALIVART
jgi:hypothetical protein